jgi:hypothetical protein
VDKIEQVVVVLGITMWLRRFPKSSLLVM